MPEPEQALPLQSIRLMLRVLIWNLYHGRALPPAGRPLADRFLERLGAWKWDVALLQEVPPWWPPALARALGVEQRTALTSRNAGLWLRRPLAARRPDLMKSNGGGSNAILARLAIAEHHTLLLRRWPERRVAQLARLADGTCVVNYHASVPDPLAHAELARLWQHTLAWAGDAALVLGGDLNVRAPIAPPGIAHVAARDPDHIFTRGLSARGPAEQLDRRVTLEQIEVELSDHVPVVVKLERADG